MPHLTHIGDGVILACLLGLLLLPDKKAETSTVILGLILLAILIYIAKEFLFDDWHRPLKAIQDTNSFVFIGTKRLHSHSFPSGHAAASLCGITFFAYFFQNNYSGFLWAIFAVILAYTRVYIGVHFWADIIAGGALGFFIAFFCLKWILPKLKAWMSQFSPKGRIFLKIFLYSLIIVTMSFEVINLFNNHYS